MKEVFLERALEHARSGGRHQDAGHFDEAEKEYLQALEADPEFTEVYNNLGVLWDERGDLDRAEAFLRQALKFKPDYPEAHNNLGRIYKQRKDWESAEECYRKALAFNPEYAGARANLGAILLEMGKIEEAIVELEESLYQKLDQPGARVNLGEAYLEKGMIDEALRCYEAALALDPEHPEAHWNRAFLWLLQGEYEKGWMEYEWRWRLEDQCLRHPQIPRWNGEKVREGALLVYAEQGFGDTIQFARYLAMTRERAGRVYLECQRPLVALMKEVCGVDQVFEIGVPIEGAVCQIPLHSLPLLFQTRRETIPSPGLWEKVTTCEPRDRESLRIGFCWSGSEVDHRRQCPFAQWKPLFQLPGTEWISLQMEESAKGVRQLMDGLKIRDAGTALQDFLQTMEALKEIDLIITIDTALAHLAGALEKPVWVMVPRVPDWRWGLEGESTPWYPTARLFRQERPGEWVPVIEKIRKALERRLGRQGLEP